MPPEQTWLLPSSDAAWPDVKRWLSAALDAAGEQDPCSAWQHLHRAAGCIRRSQRQAGTPVPGFGAAAATAGSDDAPSEPAPMPGAWADCSGGVPQQAALASVIRAALDLDSSTPPGDLGAAGMLMPRDGAFGGSGGSSPSSCRLSAAFARSLVACSLLGLLAPCEAEEQQQQEGKACSSDSCWQEKQQQQSLIPCGSWSRALMHIFSRSASTTGAQDCADVVVTRTAKPSFVAQQPLTLDEWCHQEALLCSVLVTSISDVAAAVATPAGPGDDVCLELTAASLLLQLPGRSLAQGELLQIARAPPTGQTMQECDHAAQLNDDLLALSQGDLRWLTDYQQHVCASADCCADCHVLWQLAMTYVRVAGLAVTAEAAEPIYAADNGYCSTHTTSGMSHSHRCEASVHVGKPSYRGSNGGSPHGGDGDVRTDTVCRLTTPTDHQRPDAAEPVECAVRLHSAARLRSPALVAPAIVVYESASDAADQGTVTAWDGCVSTGSARAEDGSCHFSTPLSTLPSASSSSSQSSVALDHRDTSVTAFADALAASLLGDALTCRPLPTRSESAERRPSMPTIVEEALGSSCCVGPSVCCSGGPDTAGRVTTAAAAAVAANTAPASATTGAKPLCDFADRLAADVLRDALRVTRSDSLPPEDFCIDCDRPLSPPASTLFARCGSVSSEAAAGSVCSWQSLEDFSHGLLVSAILEAKQEWFSRVSAVGGSIASEGSHDDGGGGCDSDDDAEHRATREHTRFFQWEFLDRCGSTSPSGGGWPPAGGRRGSEPTGCAAAVTASAALERRGSAPCMSATKRSLAADRRPSDYFDDEFIRRLHGGSSGSGCGEGGSRRGSAPPMHGCRADQSDDDYFAAEFSLTAHRSSTPFVGDLTTVTADRPLPRDGDAASLGESSCCGAAAIVGGYLSLYSDVLAENVMHSSFRELARRLAASTVWPARSGAVGGSLAAATTTAAALPASAAFVPPAAATTTSAVADDLDGFAVCLAERLMSDAFSSLRSTPRHFHHGCELAVLDVPALAVGCLDGGYGNEASADDEGAGESCAPDPDALALRRKSSGRRHSRSTVRGRPSSLPPVTRRAASVPMAASWECSSSGACDEAHEQLSALLCWIASSVAGIRELNIHVSQGLLAEKLEAIVRQALSMQLKAGSMATLVLEYCRSRQQQQGSTAQMPFAYISERM